jgi:hypothetical protein
MKQVYTKVSNHLLNRASEKVYQYLRNQLRNKVNDYVNDYPLNFLFIQVRDEVRRQTI